MCTCDVDTLLAGEEVLAQLEGQSHKQCPLDQAWQRGIEDHAQQCLWHGHGAVLQGPLQVHHLESGLASRPPPCRAAECRPQSQQHGRLLGLERACDPTTRANKGIPR